MLSPQVLERLGELNRQPISSLASTAASLSPLHGVTLHGPTLPIPAPHHVAVAHAPAPPNGSRELPGGEELLTAWGPCWRIEEPLSQFWPRSEDRLAEVQRRFLEQDREPWRDDLKRLAGCFPTGALYLDLETCGLAGAMIFLVGLLWHDGRTWRLTQLLARDYGEEKAVLQAMWNIAREKQVLVTFNGKSFDWPLVQDRSTMHHLGAPLRRRKGETSLGDGNAAPASDRLERRDQRPVLAHCDILHHARRKWRSRLPNCKLQTLELFLCGRQRTADIAGRDIPAAYHQYVRSKDAWPMRDVLHHNALDLATLLEVSLRAAV